MIILQDADLNNAVNAAVFSRFAHQGQVCMCSNRILVQRGVYNKFLDKFVNQVSQLKSGDPRKADTDLGPLMNLHQAETFMKQVQRGIDGGEKASGIGRLNGKWALEEFTTLKWISVQHKQRHYPFELVQKAS